MNGYSPPCFVGLDLSLTGTGLIIVDSKANLLTEKVIFSNSKDNPEDRIQQITRSILKELFDYRLDINGVYLEGISYGSQGKGFAELSGLFYYTLIRLKEDFKSINIEIIPPTSLKKYIAGKGNVKKELVILNVYKKFGVEFDNSDLADAYSLARMSLENYS